MHDITATTSQLPQTDARFLTEVFRRKLADDLALSLTFLRHPAAGHRGRPGLSHSFAVTGFPGLTATCTMRRAPAPPPRARQLTRLHPEYRAIDGEPIFVAAVTIALDADVPEHLPDPATRQVIARALVDAMHHHHVTADIHFAGTDDLNGAHRFLWFHTRTGTVLPSPARLADAQGEAA